MIIAPDPHWIASLSISSRSTAIGSLPHHNIDAALDYSFRLGIPFLPQIPIRNPWEYMIPQALEGLPGLQIEQDGSALVNLPIWERRAKDFAAKLNASLRASGPLPDFEPSASVSSLWQPFLWELSERGANLAKIQIAGPLTTQWALRARTDAATTLSAERVPELSAQIYKLSLARSLAMVRRLKAERIQPIIFLDEPALYGWSLQNPKHLLGMQELKVHLQTLRKEGAVTGLHCCSNTDWSQMLGLPIDILSLDTALSLENLLSGGAGALERFIEIGGRLALGIVPTARSMILHSLRAHDLLEGVEKTFERSGHARLLQPVLASVLFTPACGLAYHTVADAELSQQLLQDVALEVERRLGKSPRKGTTG